MRLSSHWAGGDLGASSIRGGTWASRGQGSHRSRAGAQAGRLPPGPVARAARGCALVRPHVARVVGATHLQEGNRGQWDRRCPGRRKTAGRLQTNVYLMFASGQAAAKVLPWGPGVKHQRACSPKSASESPDQAARPRPGTLQASDKPQAVLRQPVWPGTGIAQAGGQRTSSSSFW